MGILNFLQTKNETEIVDLLFENGFEMLLSRKCDVWSKERKKRTITDIKDVAHGFLTERQFLDLPKPQQKRRLSKGIKKSKYLTKSQMQMYCFLLKHVCSEIDDINIGQIVINEVLGFSDEAILVCFKGEMYFKKIQ